MVERVCQFGNCDETNTPISVNTGDQRPRFCCLEHAALWLLRQSWVLEYSRDKEQVLAHVQSALRN